MTVELNTKAVTGAGDLFNLLRELALKGQASQRGLEFSRFVHRYCLARKMVSHRDGIALAFGAYLVWCIVQDSHTCLSLNEKFLRDYTGDKELDWFWKFVMDPGDFISTLGACKAVGNPEKFASPILKDGPRLYIERYWWYENRLARWILENVGKKIPVSEKVISLAKRLFPPGPARPDWQKIAAINVASRYFGVVSGGPGTGKTRTVAAIMALIIENELEKKGSPSISLCAPTGKAAQRLTESFNKALEGMDLPDRLLPYFPEKAQTIHRLLGVRGHTGQFWHNQDHPMHWDTVIIDEASMVDLPLMVHLVDALKRDARLVLIGDKDQLASVEAGSVLADICKGCSAQSYSSHFLELAKSVGEEVPSNERQTSDLRDAVVTLVHNFRFKKGTGIHELATSVNRGDFKGAMEVLRDPQLEGVRFVSSREQPLDRLIKDEMAQILGEIKAASKPEEALARLQGQRILCSLKDGPIGTRNINRFISFLFAPETPWKRGIFHGLPIIVRENDYSINLFNGDNGIIWQAENRGRLLAFFMDSDRARGISPARLPRFEPAWAITVHVSQGSEFDRVLMILPPKQSAIIGRELLYTAITRAKEKIVIWGSEDALARAIETPAYRESGLSDRLMGRCS